MAEICLALIVLGLTAYGVLGGADFGAGFWDLTAGGAKRGDRVRGMIKRSMGPVWEANHVWLILVVTLFWTAFPPAFAAFSGPSSFTRDSMWKSPAFFCFWKSSKFGRGKKASACGSATSFNPSASRSLAARR